MPKRQAGRAEQAVDLMARGMAHAEGQGADVDPARYYRALALTALRALSTPTEAMIDAAVSAASRGCDTWAIETRADVRRSVSAMITAMIEEGQRPLEPADETDEGAEDATPPVIVTVNWQQLLEAFEFGGGAADSGGGALIDLDSGEVHVKTGDTALDEGNGLPEDADESDRFMALPDKRYLDLGRSLALEFVAEQLPGDYERVQGCFKRRGAYSRFKELLGRRDALEKWYNYESGATERALRAWCAGNGIGLK